MSSNTKAWIKDPLISIVVNCYNGERYLADALQSVISQTYQHWELIFWDNQSEDKSKKIFQSFSDKRLNYYYAPNHTVLYEARNHALKKIKGDFITFLDVDDFWETTKLEEQIREFLDDEVGLVYSNFWFTNDKKSSKRLAFKDSLPSGNISNNIIRDYPVGMLTIMVRKASLDDLQHIFDSRFQMIGDFDLVVRLSITNKLVAINRPLASYRLHSNNMSKKFRKLQNNEIETWLNENINHPIISKLAGFSYRGKLLTYYKGIEAAQNYRYIEAFNYIKKIPNKLKIKLFLYIIIPKAILKIIGRY
ncbi:glycosyltransferase [Gammaproteobacteria bacterium]|jgi:glycosyltransferase involved in cell wall biosynthesis|nr:glycosyltransferase [Gammaproteobacteria bacterium]